MMYTVDVLGTKYEIDFVNYSEEEILYMNGFAGFCNKIDKKIVIADPRTLDSYISTSSKTTQANYLNLILRHELVHAFLNESGLDQNAMVFDESWCNNEEMVDWIATQGEKLYNCWKSIGCDQRSVKKSTNCIATQFLSK